MTKTDTKNIKLVIHLVDPLIIYFPLYLGLKDLCVRGIPELGESVKLTVEYDFGSSDEVTVANCVAGAEKKIPGEYHVVLTSGDKAEGRGIRSVYPLITRAPVWGLVFGKLSKTTGAMDRNEFDECLRTRELHELEFEPRLIDGVDWFTYPKGTTTYDFCVDRLGIRRLHSSIDDIRINFKNEFECLEKRLNKDDQPVGLLTIAPWNLPDSLRKSFLTRERKDHLRVVQMPRVFFPFTSLCVPDYYIKESKNFESHFLSYILNSLVFEYFTNRVSAFYAADHSYLPHKSNPLCDEDEVTKRVHTYSEELDCSESEVRRCPSLLMERYARKQRTEFIASLPQHQEHSVNEDCVTDENRDRDYTNNGWALRRGLALYPIAKDIVDFYCEQNKVNGTEEPKWLDHLPESQRLYECLTCLAKHEIFPVDENMVLLKEFELNKEDVSLYERVRNQKALADRIKEQERTIRAETRAESAAGLLHNLRNLITPALAPAQDAIGALEAVEGNLVLPESHKPTSFDSVEGFWSFLQDRSKRIEKQTKEAISKLKVSSQPAEFIAETLDSFYEYVRSDELKNIRTKNTGQISNQLLNILHSTWTSPRRWVIPDEKRPEDLLGKEHAAEWKARVENLNQARQQHGIHNGQSFLWKSNHDSGKLICSFDDHVKESKIVAGVIVQHILYELMWNGIKSIAERRFLEEKTEDYHIELRCSPDENPEFVKWTCIQTPCEEDDALTVVEILDSPSGDSKEMTFRGLRGVKHLSDRLNASVMAKYSSVTQELRIELRTKIEEDRVN